MASSPTPGAPRRPHHGSERGAVKDGHLPVTELLSDRPGAASPFGDDLTFPLPASAVVYRHPGGVGH